MGTPGICNTAGCRGTDLHSTRGYRANGNFIPHFLGKCLLTLLLLNLSACSAMQPVDVEQAMRQPPAAGIDIGSLVEVRTLDGERMKFRVTDMNESGLDGKFGLIAFENMARLEVEKPAGRNGKAGSYIISALGIAALIALIDSADTVRVCSSPPCE